MQVGNLHVAIDELFTFGAHYVTLKAKMAHEASVSMHDQSSPSADRMPLREEFGWFRPSRVIALDEDFVGLDESTLGESVPGSWVGARRPFQAFLVPQHVPHGFTPRS